MDIQGADIRFRCPQCGGSAFGSMSETADPKGPLLRFCHGDDARDGRAGCRFRWPEGDDWRHFLVNGKALGPEEYQGLMEKIRSTPLAGSEDGPPFAGHTGAERARGH